MRKMYLALPVIAIAAAVLGGIYTLQPDRLTPARMKRAVMVETELRKIDETEAAIEAGLDGEAAAVADEEAPVQLAQAEPTEDATPAGEEAPDVFQVLFETTKGDVVAEFHKEWSPAGAQRVYDLVKAGYFTDARFFRVIKGFMAQFGLSATPELTAKWGEMNLPSEPVKQSNTPGMISFAMIGRPARPGWTDESRTTQLFISTADNARLDNMFAPVGKVVSGMTAVERLYNEYGEGAPNGNGPSQSMIEEIGNKYLEQYFPKLDYIKVATIVPQDAMVGRDAPPAAPATPPAAPQ
jgi:peptidyl-prolyl cis-trans isomerase A (cyclophilin A)